MKKVLYSLALSLALTCPAFAQTPTTESVKELLKLTDSEKLLNQSYAQINTVIESTANQIKNEQGKPLTPEQKEELKVFGEKLTKLYQKEFSWNKLEPDFIKIYRDVYSQEEIDGMITFYKSPIGQSMLQKLPLVMQKSMLMIQQQSATLIPQISQLAKESFKNNTMQHQP